MKYIFVSGGVVSGLGKGIVASSIGSLLQKQGLKVTLVKVDMYLNIDAGTIRPQEHGEVFVTQDGLETDQDLGNYERFLNVSLHRENYMTAGQVYKAVIDRERAFGYEGEDVEAIPHVTSEIINRINQAGKKNNAQITITELGGTVGEYQNAIFFEASRILRLEKPRDVLQVHVTYLPFLKNLGELKSKPAQQSVQHLNAMGIQPDIIITRGEKPIDQKRKDKIAIFCNVNSDSIIDNPDLENIYQVPQYLESQNITKIIIKKLHLKNSNSSKPFSTSLTHRNTTPSCNHKIAIIGKYFETGDYKLTDSYVSVIEAIKHASNFLNVKPHLDWISSHEVEENKIDMSQYSGIIIPQGWGSRGTEGKIKAIEHARINQIPYLGLCFGMQMAVIEYARHVLKLQDANSEEVDSFTTHPVIHIMPDQAKYLANKQYGGTIRLGSWPCLLAPHTLISDLYSQFGKDQTSPWWSDRNNNKNTYSSSQIFERHRHRYEFNNDYKDKLEKAGLIISGLSPDGKLVEAIEITDHPFFIGTQFHPEYISRPQTPHPIFMGFIKTVCNK